MKKMNEHEFCETFDSIKNDMKQLKETFKAFKSKYNQIAKATKKLYNYGDEHMFIGTEAGYKPKHNGCPYKRLCEILTLAKCRMIIMEHNPENPNKSV